MMIWRVLGARLQIFFAGKLLEKVSEGDLTCEGRPSTTTTEVTYSTSRTTTESELEIIWEPENKSTRRPKPPVTQPTLLPKHLNLSHNNIKIINDDIPTKAKLMKTLDTKP